ncbi:unnamed protein product [Rhizophagus irregularis]|nr:unnamed protein product [Rhizophagus irregularis]
MGSLMCFQLTKHVLNDERSSEYQNNTLLKHIKKAEQILQNVFYKKDNKISLKALPQLHKVKTILNEYNEPLEKATKDNFVDLDSILFVPSYQGNYKFQQH